jgi:RNA recognition motif-containing protein
VGNLSFEVTDADLNKLFGQFGAVAAARVVNDTYSGRSKGFGFVEYESTEEGQSAIQNLDGTEFMGRQIKVNQARPKASGSRY